MSKPVIYLGPSLDLATAKSVLEATYLPPIKRGDLAKLGADIETVGIVDGEFFQNLSVSTMEILPLLDRGVQVYGSSSIGALRAVETELFGMVGIGEIFTWFRDNIVDADDEVALAYNSATFRPCSEPLINIRFALKEAACEGIVDDWTANHIVEEVRKIYFPFRSLHLAYRQCPKLKEFFSDRQPNRKRDDALELLHVLAKA